MMIKNIFHAEDAKWESYKKISSGGLQPWITWNPRVRKIHQVKRICQNSAHLYSTKYPSGVFPSGGIGCR